MKICKERIYEVWNMHKQYKPLPQSLEWSFPKNSLGFLINIVLI